MQPDQPEEPLEVERLQYDPLNDTAEPWKDPWRQRFGDSYDNDMYDANELDDQELSRLEDEFRNDHGDTTPSAPLDELED